MLKLLPGWAWCKQTIKYCWRYCFCNYVLRIIGACHPLLIYTSWIGTPSVWLNQYRQSLALSNLFSVAYLSPRLQIIKIIQKHLNGSTSGIYMAVQWSTLKYRGKIFFTRATGLQLLGRWNDFKHFHVL